MFIHPHTAPLGRWFYRLDSTHADYLKDLATLKAAFARTHPQYNIPVTYCGDGTVVVATNEPCDEVTGTVLRALLPWVERHPGSVVEVSKEPL